jgi:hypothetical protein
MWSRAYFILTGILLGIVAIGHMSRLLYHWPIVVGGWSPPMWVSVPGVLIPGLLSGWGILLAIRARC